MGKSKKKLLDTIKKTLTITLVFVLVACPHIYKGAQSDPLSFSLNYAKPSVSDNNGYCNVLLYNKLNGKYETQTYFYNASLYNIVTENPTGVFQFTKSDSGDYFDFYIYFTGVESESSRYSYNLYRIDNQGRFSLIGRELSNSTRVSLSNYNFVGYKCGGNVRVDYPAGASNMAYSITFNSSEESEILRDVYVTLLDMKDELVNQGLLTEELKELIDSALTEEVTGYDISKIAFLILGKLEQIETGRLWQISLRLEEQVELLNNILEEEEKQTGLLEDILSSLGGTNENSGAIDDFKEESNQKGEQIKDSVNELNSVEKPDADSLVSDLDSVMPTEGKGYVSSMFDSIYQFEYPKQMLILVFSFGLVGYVLFGKRK